MSKSKRPPHIAAELKAAAEAKRKRRASKPGASNYAKANWPR